MPFVNCAELYVETSYFMSSVHMYCFSLGLSVQCCTILMDQWEASHVVISYKPTIAQSSITVVKWHRPRMLLFKSLLISFSSNFHLKSIILMNKLYLTLEDIVFVACYLFIQLDNVNLRKENSVLCSLIY